MQLLTFAPRNDVSTPRIGVMRDGAVIDLTALDRAMRQETPDLPLPVTMRGLLAAGEAGLARVRVLIEFAGHAGRDAAAQWTVPLAEAAFHPPVPDAEKFLCVGKNYRKHLEELRRNDLILETPQEPTGFSL